MKLCVQCGVPKALTDFYFQRRRLRMSVCKRCHCANVTANRAYKIEFYREYERNRRVRLARDSRARLGIVL